MICPLPKYWMCHILIALLISAILWPFVGPLGLIAGAGFYTVRELYQWRSGLPFDWPGLLAPVGACAIVLVIALLLG